MKFTEIETEKKFRAFAELVYAKMGWGKMPVTRFKYSNTLQWKGHCFGRYLDGKPHSVYVNISSNPLIHPTEKDVWNSLLHELVHVKLHWEGYPIPKAFGHGKAFKNVVKEMVKVSNGLYSYKRIMK